MDSPHLSSTRFCLAIKFQHGFAGQEPLELGKLLRYAIGIASPIDALPHALQGLLAAHGPALEERLIISRRPPGTDIRHGGVVRRFCSVERSRNIDGTQRQQDGEQGEGGFHSG